MKQDDLNRLNEARRNRKAVLTITDLADADTRIVVEGEVLDDAFADAAQTAFRSGKSGLIDLDGRSLFVNVHLPPPRICVIGAVHISQALARMAEIAGFDLRIIDPRTAFATEERFSGIALQAEWPEDALKVKSLDPHTALVAVTHDPKIDDLPIREALLTGCFYVGALGSKKTHGRRLERLWEAGVGEPLLATIRAPIGLPIGASSPEEIAVAILAEIIAAYRSRSLLSTAEATR